MKKIQYLTLLVAISLGLVTLAPAFAAAQSNYGTTNAAVNATVTAGTPAGSASVSLTAAEKTAVSRGDKEIDRRIAALTDLNTRIQAMQKVTDTFKAGISASITNEINTLTSLKAKIDADTDLTTLKTDIQSITASYRVFALVLPQGRIAAFADREVELVSMMSTLGAKLQARIATAGQGGADVSALTTALTDMAAKLKDAQAQAEAAVTASSSLAPDNGDKTKMAANDAALKTARADLVAAQKDLAAARKDVATIVSGLNKLNAAANASTTTQVSH
jgi:hypothetical protein